MKSILLTICCAFALFTSQAQEIPFVYEVENTGENCSRPPLPDFANLPVVNPLTDPFEWSDGSSRDTTFESWSCRRNEIKLEIEEYEIGKKPEKPDTMSATFANNMLTITITKNGQTLVMTSQIKLPKGDGPFPAIIGMGGGTGSLPASIFDSRNIAQIAFNFSQITQHTQSRGKEPINKLYPDLIHMGSYSAWSWGVSRLIDGLELVADVLPIDLSHLAVSGCSFAGKMALFAGAFDERIALTIVQESGGGGGAAWRVSETLGSVETLGATNHSWFMESMFRFAGKNVAKLPHDHHELMAMVAPRALLFLGNPDMVWLADESGYVSCRAAHEVWKNFGIGDRFGFSILGGHGHCALPAVQYPEVEAFVEKFLLGNTEANTNVTISNYGKVNYNRWIEWWGKGESYFPEQFFGKTIAIEAECAILGADWIKKTDTNASNNAYVVSKEGTELSKRDMITEDGYIEFPFTVDSVRDFSVFARINCPTSDNDAFWKKMDNGFFGTKQSAKTNGWEWVSMGDYKLEKGNHSFFIAYRETGGQIDKILLTSKMFYEPIGLEEAALNICDPRVGINNIEVKSGYALDQNYPNPVNGFTNISFSIPRNALVSLKVSDINGSEIAELAGKEFSHGNHSVVFDTHKLPKGIYFYTLRTNNFTTSRKMIIND